MLFYRHYLRFKGLWQKYRAINAILSYDPEYLLWSLSHEVIFSSATLVRRQRCCRERVSGRSAKKEKKLAAVVAAVEATAAV